MLIFLLSYIGGALTIFSPCVLPVLPFIFARPDQSFRRSGLPILLGMAATFTVLASLATIAGAWLVALRAPIKIQNPKLGKARKKVRATSHILICKR